MTELSHYGVKGMKWGVRKDRSARREAKAKAKAERPKRTSEEKRAIAKKVAVGVGALTVTAGAAFAANYLRSKGGTTVADIPEAVANAGSQFVKNMESDHVSVMHAARGRDYGWSIFKDGGFPSPLSAYENSPLDRASQSGETNFFERFGSGSKQAAAIFKDPEGRKDHAGRFIEHEILIPPSMTDGVNSIEDVVEKIWPQIKEAYEPRYVKPKGKGMNDSS